MVTRVCGSVGRLNPTTVVNDENSHFETLNRPQRVRRVTPHTLNFVRDGIILADLHKSLLIWGWFLPKKIDPHPRGGVEVGILGCQKIKTPGNVNCHELSRKSIKFVFFTHPTPGGSGGGGGWESKFKKSGKFHELSRKSTKKSPPPQQRGSQWEF